MKKKNLLFSAFTVLLLSVVGVIILTPIKLQNNAKTNESATEEKKEKGIDGAMEFYKRMKANFQTGEIDVDQLLLARKEVRNIPTSKSFILTWEEMGPNNVGGRVRALLIDKDNPSIMWAGGVAGGLWKSTTAGQSWVQIPLSGNIAVTSITQSPNGDIYVGTGEGLAQPRQTNYNSGALGDGIYYKEASSSTFTQLTATAGWQKVNRLAADNTGKVYAATVNGLKSTTDNGLTWGQSKAGNFADVKTASGSALVVASSGNKVYISSDTGSTWQTAALPSTGIDRIEVAVSPSNPAYIYAVLAADNGSLYGVYRTTDGGSTWTKIAVGGTTSFQLFGPNGQGWYDNVAMVHKTNPDIVYVGGIDMWKGQFVSAGNPFSWTKKTVWNASATSSVYVHADQHVYCQHPTDPNTFYLGTDGGIFKTIDGGNTFATLNKNFNVTQFYAVSPFANGGAIGGAQDNGTQFLDLMGNNPQQARDIRGGDGGWSASSALNQEVIFASIYFGNVARSNDFGETFQEPTDPATGDPEFYSETMNSGLGGAFVTPVILWETIDFQNSIDSINYVADQNYTAGAVVDGRSYFNNLYPFAHTLTHSMNKGDTIRLMDPIQSRLFIGTLKGIYMTKQALFFANKTPAWFRVSTMKYAGSAVWNMKISKDGDVLYYAVDNHLLRLSNLLAAQDSATADISGANYLIQDTLIKNFSAIISSISIDPSDANRVIVTLSGTGNEHVYYSSNATSANPTFATKRGNLPTSLPVYASLIPVNQSTQVVIGTEYGMYATSNILAATPVWEAVNTGVDPFVPVYMLSQQQNNFSWRQTITLDNGNPIVSVYPGVYNYGQIYAATHGRGIFTAKNYLSIADKKQSKFTQLSNLQLFPNPVSDRATLEFVLGSTQNAKVKVFDMNGRLIRTFDLGLLAGEQKIELDLSDLSNGVYIMNLQTAEKSISRKFIVN
jgi:photosystem II stability/assembly factor-like uncharacterized protein